MNRIGFDIGGVIIAQDTDEPELFFTNDFLRAKPFPNCFEIIQKVIFKYGKENIFLISKCGQSVQRKSRDWLVHQNFFSRTGFDNDNIFFCLERYEKASIVNDLNLDIFVDDRYTVLEHMILIEKIKSLILFSPNEREQELSKTNFNSKIQEVSNWEAVGKILAL